MNPLAFPRVHQIYLSVLQDLAALTVSESF